ncbi:MULTISPECIES: hypothetical protein [Fischerella]|uniref:hypothetical protein n=1 Tax=Fischerella TaxID=1190 RepID=UPI0012F73140|nr:MULTISPECIES: hypothetical protein [Fischerella]MBD2434742.1 hypothetical protein [Fischerella sp. FACHB-380]
MGNSPAPTPPREWGLGAVGRWGSGEVGRWGGGERSEAIALLVHHISFEELQGVRSPTS